MKFSFAIVAAAAAILSIGSVAACSSGGDGPLPVFTSPTNDFPTDVLPTDDLPTDGTDSVDPPASDGEIWQWALGRDAWTDRDLARYTQGLGRGDDTDVNVQSEGFKLSLDASGTVVAVTVFNDETDLGFPASETNFRAYEGRLPMNLSWDDTATDIQRRYGATNQSGGFGTSVVFRYTTDDGYGVEVGFAARHQTDLPGSPMHYITVART